MKAMGSGDLASDLAFGILRHANLRPWEGRMDFAAANRRLFTEEVTSRCRSFLLFC